MHGTLSAGILIGAFGAVAAAGLYAAVRLLLAGGRLADAGNGASATATAGPDEP